MNILLIQFTNDSSAFIKSIFNDIESTKYKLVEVKSIGEAISQNLLTDIEFIICYVNKESEVKCAFRSEIINSTPILFITHSSFKISNEHKLHERCNFLPENQITNFILESFIINTIEKFEIKSKLNKIELIQSELSVKEAKYRDLFENSTIGMYEIDPDGNFILANQVLLDILGLENFSALKKFNAFEPGISVNGTRQKLKKILLEKEKVDDFEDEWIKSDKSKIIVKENIKVQKDVSGSVKNYYGVVQDITESKKVQLELVQSKKDAEKSDRLKSEFLTQISHEIRTPVNTLLSFATLIEDDLKSTLSEDLIDSFLHMNRAGKRITRTIDLLVKMSELHTDNYEPEFKDNDLFELLDELVENYKPFTDEKGLNLQFIKAIDSANIVFDRHTMYDVFSNLIDNAIKYTMEGSIKIYVKKSLLNKIAVTIIDTGIGISEKYLNNIFTPFSQETGGYTREFDGNGLGLALVKEYCELNNADIFVNSEKNNGSNFTVIFK